MSDLVRNPEDRFPRSSFSNYVSGDIFLYKPNIVPFQSPNNEVRYFFSNILNNNNFVDRFSLDSFTGDISVRRNLYGENFNEFNVSKYSSFVWQFLVC